MYVPVSTDPLQYRVYILIMYTWYIYIYIYIYIGLSSSVETRRIRFVDRDYSYVPQFVRMHAIAYVEKRMGHLLSQPASLSRCNFRSFFRQVSPSGTLQ